MSRRIEEAIGKRNKENRVLVKVSIYLNVLL